MFNKTFLNGLKALAPITLTLVLLLLTLKTIEDFFGYFVLLVLPQEFYFIGLGAMVGLVFVFIMGLAVNAWIFQKLYSFSEFILRKIPFVNAVYRSIQELVYFFDHEKKKKGKPVIVELPMGRVIGFVTRENFEDLENVTTKDEVAVYIPLSYQIGGFTVFIKKSELKTINLSVEKAMRFVLTAGITDVRSPKQVQKVKKKKKAK